MYLIESTNMSATALDARGLLGPVSLEISLTHLAIVGWHHIESMII